MKYLSCRAESAILTSKSKKGEEEELKEKNPLTIQKFHYSDLEAATNGFSNQKLLGRGSHGCVYKGVLSNGRLVAVKKPSRSSSASSAVTASSSSDATNNHEVDNEIHILSKIRSPSLVNLVGFSTTRSSKDRLLVVEFMCNGTLYDVLHSASRPPNWARRLRLSLQTAKAIETLHSLDPPVIHRDIKSANVLIDRNFNARLSDFGLALQCHVDNFRTPPAGTIGYLDPAYLTPHNLSTKTDVFSFGILLLEIISGRKAIDIGYSPPSILEWAIPLIRRGRFLAIYDPRIPPPKDPSLRKQLPVLAAKCVRSSWERRPSIKDVVESLGVMSKMLPGHTWNSFSVNNPCMMLEEVGHQVESRINATTGTTLFNSSSRPNRLNRQGPTTGDMRNSTRVYSDLGLGVGRKNNLMNLMAETETNSDNRNNVFNLRRNQSVGPNFS